METPSQDVGFGLRRFRPSPVFVLTVILTLALGIGAAAVSPSVAPLLKFPKVTTVDPATGRVGDIISAKGENLDKSSLGEIYLTDGSLDTKAQIAGQTETEIKFKVPDNIKAGRYRLLVLTADKNSLLEQPVVFKVE